MLEDLELLNVGPAPRMKAQFAPRVNLVTGDKRSVIRVRPVEEPAASR